MASHPTRLHVREFHKCESEKVGYQTKAEALDGAERMMEAGLVRPGCHITPYPCTRCGEWHVANRIIVPIDSEWWKARKRGMAR